jgi:Family of unknown function (DUF6940)/TIR domain
MHVFLSYRRSDFGGQADFVVGRLHDGLEQAFGSGSAYWDSEIPHASDFPRVIETEIAQSDAVVVLVGPDWAGEFKTRSAHEDHVLYEIETAIRLQIPLVPVLGPSCRMPNSADLPAAISTIASRNAVVLGRGSAYAASFEALHTLLRQLSRRKVFESGRFGAVSESDTTGAILTYKLTEDSRTLSYRAVLNRWENDVEFTDFYLTLFEQAGFGSYVWETPSVSQQSSERDFEFALLKQPIASLQPDRERYRQYFDAENSDAGVVVFDNLRGDTKLVVPSPLRSDANYSNLALFSREAPVAQQRALWRVVARTVNARLGDAPLWLSVAGGGIAWLHVRLDPRPKYYRHAPYRTAR